MRDLTTSQRAAMRALVEGGGEACIDRNGVAVVAGQRLTFDSVTWLRLFTLGAVEPAGELRFRATDAGCVACGRVVDRITGEPR